MVCVDLNELADIPTRGIRTCPHAADYHAGSGRRLPGDATSTDKLISRELGAAQGVSRCIVRHVNQVDS
eukprot:CAMPEP_0182803654 /NCGR_PEP_ID=MMETSP0006_2-20121128/4146_1 /TAXON_ID=97485 /ORGANISM="Prymnesium parvum, Strain Texoma1" /LENGTH=68 /DNA_ID=CAMNT_0024929147 /DNA_START=568 /DNA_END=771 /DNA_ORIENTATION=+